MLHALVRPALVIFVAGLVASIRPAAAVHLKHRPAVAVKGQRVHGARRGAGEEHNPIYNAIAQDSPAAEASRALS